METNNTGLANITNEVDFDLSIDFTSRKTDICTVVVETPEEQAALFNGVNNPKGRVADHINEVLHIKDIFIELVELTNTHTLELEKAPRIVLFDDKGNTFACVSWGIYRSLKKLVAAFGPPTWETPLPLCVRQIKKGDKSVLTFEVMLGNKKDK